MPLLQALIISISSDIGGALARHWQQCGIQVTGTYRRESALVNELHQQGIKMVACDLEDGDDVPKACAQLRSRGPWDYLVLCPGSLEPVGPFQEVNFDQWAKSVELNFTRQLQCVHELLPARNLSGQRPPDVIFFAGGGTNNATLNYSAYTVSKIALIKMCELLDAEIPDTSFVIVGPGWVKTKIHEATLQAGMKAGANYQKTIEKLDSKECTPMAKVLECCDWLITAERNAVSGRNFSVVFDQWGSEELVKNLKEDPHMYKLRRYGNER